MRFAVSTKRVLLALFAAGAICLATVQPVSACPMCKVANETDSRLPQAYMYSILFMLGMPASLATAFGIGFYRLSRKAAEQPQDADNWYNADLDGPRP
jgi:hypothetical protein